MTARYHVTYYYLATGMEGLAQEEDYGVVLAKDKDEAKDIAARQRHPTMKEQDIEWVKGCLTAKRCLA